ncbi:MAG: phospholipase, partial [Rhodospirillaceae bacterium]|nr:phospholipase [Rhodospirillaceae bacterium]
MDVVKIDGPRQPAASGTTEQLVILVHGYGADGNDLIGLAPYFARALPNAAFVAPNGPERCEMSPMGYQWFPIKQFDPTSRLTGVQSAAPILDQFIDQELASHGLSEENLLLVGFSQGTMMSL